MVGLAPQAEVLGTPNADLKGATAPVDRIPTAADRRGAVPAAGRRPGSDRDCGTLAIDHGDNARRHE